MIINPFLYSGQQLPELDNPGTAPDLLAGKQLIDQQGKALTGTMPTVTAALPTISVSANGLISANTDQAAGYVSASQKSATKQMSTKSGTTITPGTSQKTAVLSGVYTTGAVYVAGDANLKAANIKSGVSIFGINGEAKTCEKSELTITNSTGCVLSVSFKPYSNTAGQVVIQRNSSITIYTMGGFVVVDFNGGFSELSAIKQVKLSFSNKTAYYWSALTHRGFLGNSAEFHAPYAILQCDPSKVATGSVVISF